MTFSYVCIKIQMSYDMNFVDSWKNKYSNTKYIVTVTKPKLYTSFKTPNVYDTFSSYV